MKKRFILMERDCEVCKSLYVYRYLTGKQIQLLHFPSQRTADRRIHLLVEHDYIQSFNVPGVSERLLSLKRLGAELVENMIEDEGHMGVLPWNASRSRPKDYYFVKHFIEVNQFRIFLTQACEKSGDIELVGYLPEHFGKKTQKGGLESHIKSETKDMRNPKTVLTHTPDGVFCLRHKVKGTYSIFFIEIDRGREVVGDLERGVLKCLYFYTNYILHQGIKHYEKDFSCQQFRGARVLFVTTSRRRIENIQSNVGKMRVPEQYKKVLQYIWLTENTGGITDDALFFEPVWNTLEKNDLKFRLLKQ